MDDFYIILGFFLYVIFTIWIIKLGGAEWIDETLLELIFGDRWGGYNVPKMKLFTLLGLVIYTIKVFLVVFDIKLWEV